MFITKKRLNQILDEKKMEYERELLNKDRQISMLETELLLKELLIKVGSVSERFEVKNYGTK